MVTMMKIISNGHFARLISKVKNKDFAGLLIRLNTPGGSGFASESIRPVSYTHLTLPTNA